MAHDVFICHPSEDKPTADAVVARLEAGKIRCWIAPRDVLPSEEWAGAIVHAIANSRLLILVFSENTNRSAHVTREVEQAVQRGIPILPFRIEDVAPEATLEYFIGGTHWLDALTPPLEQHLDRLAVTAGLLIDRMKEAEQERQAGAHASHAPSRGLEVEEEVAAAIAEASGVGEATSVGSAHLQWEVAPARAAGASAPVQTIFPPAADRVPRDAEVAKQAVTGSAAERRSPAAVIDRSAAADPDAGATPGSGALEGADGDLRARPKPPRRSVLVAVGAVAVALLVVVAASMVGGDTDTQVLGTTITAPSTTIVSNGSTTLPPTTVAPTTVATTTLPQTTTVSAGTTSQPPTPSSTTTKPSTTTTRAPTTTTTTTTTIVAVVARNDSYTMTDRRQTCFDVTANDTGTPALRVTAVTGSQFGSAKAADCGILYTPPDGIARPDAYLETLTYTLTDGRGATDTASVSISVR